MLLEFQGLQKELDELLPAIDLNSSLEDRLFTAGYPRKISWARNYSERYWFHSDLKKSELHPLG
ncbi:MAG: hypothetical protein L3J75_02500 [Methylococcaceae bacterium]|nr:hypothetical protein [Methylococcaceae bacterium]